MRVENEWRATAAYLYVLTLDQSGIAWEYLRRNLRYRAQWRDADAVEDWGCFTGEDPDVDARTGQPRWANRVSVSLIPVTCASGASSRFSLWRIPGRKQLFHEGPDLQLWSRTHPSVAQLRLALGLGHSDSFAYVLPADNLLSERLMAVRETQADYEAAKKLPASTATCRPSRADIFHVRALQALDAIAAGASHRDIAEVLFGTETVAGCWGSDSEIRAQVRYLIRRAAHYVNGGYRTLLGATNGRERRSMG